MASISSLPLSDSMKLLNELSQMASQAQTNILIKQAAQLGKEKTGLEDELNIARAMNASLKETKEEKTESNPKRQRKDDDNPEASGNTSLPSLTRTI
jgi:hypothetical protein